MTKTKGTDMYCNTLKFGQNQGRVIAFGPMQWILLTSSVTTAFNTEVFPDYYMEKITQIPLQNVLLQYHIIHNSICLGNCQQPTEASHLKSINTFSLGVG